MKHLRNFEKKVSDPFSVNAGGCHQASHRKARRVTLHPSAGAHLDVVKCKSFADLHELLLHFMGIADGLSAIQQSLNEAKVRMSKMDIMLFGEEYGLYVNRINAMYDVLSSFKMEHLLRFESDLLYLELSDVRGQDVSRSEVDGLVNRWHNGES